MMLAAGGIVTNHHSCLIDIFLTVALYSDKTAGKNVKNSGYEYLSYIALK